MDIRSSLCDIMDAEDKDTYPIIMHLNDLIDDTKITLKDSLK